MNKIILESFTKGKTDDIKEILESAGAFSITCCEDGIDKACNIAENEKYDLLIFNLDDIPENSYVSIMRLQMACPDISVLAYGETLLYTEFLSKYLGEKVNQLEKPAEAGKVIKTVCRALNLSNDVMKALKKKVGQAALETDKRPMVLLIDDNAMTLRSMKAALEDRYKISVASSGQSGLRQLKKKRPDIILLDYEMPDMDGREVLEKIRADKDFKDIKVYFLTSVSDTKKVRAVMKLKPLGYLLKPIENETLIEAIEKGLQKG